MRLENVDKFRKRSQCIGRNFGVCCDFEFKLITNSNYYGSRLLFD